MAKAERDVEAELREEERALLISARRSRMGGITLIVIGALSIIGMVDSTQTQKNVSSRQITSNSVEPQEQEKDLPPQGYLSLGVFSGGAGVILLDRAQRKKEQASWMYEERTGRRIAH